ncbi:hypothetical protein BJV77DRAFT_1070847 [Russula vinacea]|nr:hypothetical protein BJV77DRAFT_1070847 [Russula vinacea]
MAAATLTGPTLDRGIKHKRLDVPSKLERYVSDNALQLFGLSDKSIVDFVIAPGAKAPADEEADGPVTPDETEEFPEGKSERRKHEREQDLRKRDEFSECIRRRDKDNTKKFIEDHSSKASNATAEAALRRQLADDTVARTLQVELLQREIADDEALFCGMRISKREPRELDHKKEALKLVEEGLSVDDKWDRYVQPEGYLTEQGKIIY